MKIWARDAIAKKINDRFKAKLKRQELRIFHNAFTFDHRPTHFTRHEIWTPEQTAAFCAERGLRNPDLE